MIVIPAIDIKGGRCVRLTRGDMGSEVVYSEEPSAVARAWEDKGASLLHVVDLDGAIKGGPVNGESIRKIVEAVKIPVQVGGGIRDLETVKYYFSMGVERIILGTAAIRDPDLVRAISPSFPGRIWVALDARSGMVSVDGWTSSAGHGMLDLAEKLKDMGAHGLIYTDIMRDGMMTGPDIEGARGLLESIDLPFIISGGISSLDDLRAVSSLEAVGVITGKALYENKFDLGDAIKIMGILESLSKIDFKKDKSGLIPAVVQDEGGNVLMLAYMNEEALEKTLDTGFVHFFSRSRRSLWKKGETSGNLQKVLSVWYDCDGDAILVKADQKGVACHTGERSCFFRKLDL